MEVKFRQNFSFSLILIIFTTCFVFCDQAKAQEQWDAAKIEAQESSKGTRIIISTSGPAEFSSHWLDGPPRLVVEFQSRNILSKIDDEIVVNRGVIKNIKSSYEGRGRNRALKTLTFELTKKVGYKIWQAGNNIILDIQSPSGVELLTGEGSLISFGMDKAEVVDTGGTDERIIKRLEAMDVALKEVLGGSVPIKTFEVKEEILEGIDNKTETEVTIPKTENLPADEPEAVSIPEGSIVRERRTIWGLIFGFIGLILFSSLWLLLCYKRRLSIDAKLETLKSELQEKDNRLKDEVSIRKAVEKASLEKDHEYKKLRMGLQEIDSRLKQTGSSLEEERKVALEKEKERKRLELELQDKNSQLKEAQNLHKEARRAVLEKEEQYKKLKDSYSSLEDIMIKKALVKKMISPEGKETFWIHGKSQEKRAFPRLSLTKDFNKSIVVRIEPQSQPYKRCFVNNISSGGLCLESPKEFFKEKETVNLRLFFYGDKVPMIKAQARIIWKRSVGQIYYYGVSFELLEEEDKLEFNRYIETNIAEKSYSGGINGII